MIMYKYDNSIIYDYHNMGKWHYIVWRKWVLQNLTIGSTLPNSKNFFLAIVLYQYTFNIWGKKKSCPPCDLSVSPNTYIHTASSPVRSWLCALYVSDEIWRFQRSKHCIPPLTRLLCRCKDTTFSLKSACNKEKT